MNVWSRLGLSVAIASVFCIVIMEVFQDKTYYQIFKWYACGSFAVGGLLLVLLAFGLRARVKRHAPISIGPVATPEPTEAAPELCVASHFTFWGPILLVFGAIVFFIPYKEKAKEPVAARETPAAPAPPPSVKEPPPPPATFPEIKIQGLVYRPPKSAVIINNKSYFVGDNYQDAEIVAIEATNITLQVNGQRKVVAYEDARLRK